MRILALDTTTEACSAALWHDGVIAERYLVAPQQQARLILPMADVLMKEAGITHADLDAVAFANGPGSFTGVRLVTGIVQGIAFALKLPVITVSSLQALAQVAQDDYAAEHVIACIDARMSEVYWGAYIVDDEGLMQPDPSVLENPAINRPEKVPLPNGTGWIGVGTGWKYEALVNRLSESVKEYHIKCYPKASAIAKLARAKLNKKDYASAQAIAPIYLRDKVV